MSMTDPIADFLTRIRNGQLSGKPEIAAPSSRSWKVVFAAPASSPMYETSSAKPAWSESRRR